MRRLALVAAVVLSILLFEQRVDDPLRSSRRTPDPVPAAWSATAHEEWSSTRASAETLANHRRSEGYETGLRNCPFVLSPDAESAYPFTSAEQGVRFDIDDDGAPELVSWTERGSDVAFLALDRDGNGRITSGAELLSDRARPGSDNGANALIGLAAEALGDRRAFVDDGHPLFQRLLLWTDVNHDGISEPDELRPVRDSLAAIGLGFTRHHLEDRHGNHSRFRGWVLVRTGPGAIDTSALWADTARRRYMYDVCLTGG